MGEYNEYLDGYYKRGERWAGIERSWTLREVLDLRCSPFRNLYEVSAQMSRHLWNMLNEGTVRALGASTPAQAIQMVEGGLEAIYLSGWQVAADVNGDMYPDQSLYTCDSVPKLCAAINNAMLRQCQVTGKCYVVPIVADGEAGFGGALNVYELTKKAIEAGAAAIHFEDQLASEKKCGHMGGKVLVPTSEFITKLKAARLAADVCGVPLVIIARTDANSAKLLTSDVDACDRKFIKYNFEQVFGNDVVYDHINKMGRTIEGFYSITGGIEMAIHRGLAYAPYADLLWCETSTPDLEEARQFANAIHEKFPGKLLAYNNSPSFNWEENLTADEIAAFQNELSTMGYVFQFVTLAGFHSLNNGMFELAREYNSRHMSGYVDLQRKELTNASKGYRAVKHQGFVGTGYFDKLRTIIGNTDLGAMNESTEEDQFK